MSSNPSSFKSITLSTPNLTKVVVELTDGTVFETNDTIESSTSPLSPLKIISKARDQKIPFGTNLVERKGLRNNYSNERVKIAEGKEEMKRVRIKEDEEFRKEKVREQEEREEL